MKKSKSQKSSATTIYDKTARKKLSMDQWIIAIIIIIGVILISLVNTVDSSYNLVSLIVGFIFGPLFIIGGIMGIFFKKAGLRSMWTSYIFKGGLGVWVSVIYLIIGLIVSFIFISRYIFI